MSKKCYSKINVNGHGVPVVSSLNMDPFGTDI